MLSGASSTSDSVVLADLCRSAAIHKAAFNLALARLMDSGPYDDADQARPAYEALRRADADLPRALKTFETPEGPLIVHPVGRPHLSNKYGG